MKILLASFFLITLNAAIAQQIRGSFFIGAICKDGILIGEDTRLSIPKEGVSDIKKREDIYCTMDTFQKIFPLKKFVFFSEGAQSFLPEGNTLYYYLHEFDNKIRDSVSSIDAPKLFYSFISKFYPDKYKDFFASNMSMVFAGYFQGVPYLCSLKDTDYNCQNSGVVLTGSSDYFMSVFGPDSNITCSQLAPVLEESIKDYIKTEKTEYFMGGPIMLMKITPNNKIVWIKNKPKHFPMLNITALDKGILANIYHVIYIDSKDKNKIENFLRNWIASHP